MHKLKCLIVDDEPLALEVLETYISGMEYLDLAGRCKNAVEASNFLQQNRVDLMFLDIQMPQLTGLGFLKTLKNPPAVVLTTAFRDYALESYEFGVLDYLLKPVSFERFLVAVNKAFPKVPSTLPAQAESLNGDEAFFYVKSDKKMVKVLLKDVLYIESVKDFVRIRTRETELEVYQTISSFEDKLPDNRFARVHKGFIVGLHHITAFTAVHIEIQGKLIPIGRMYKDATLKRLGVNTM